MKSNIHQVTKTWIKIYPAIMLAAIRINQGGACRSWIIARFIDRHGCGFVTKKELIQKLTELAVSKRQQRRWLSAALKIGIFRQSRGRYYLTSLGNTGSKFGARIIGVPALIDPYMLVSKHWRSRIWSGYLTTLHNRPVSQSTKYLVTGITPRTQHNYQVHEPGLARENYTKTKLRPDQITGMIENEGGTYYETSKKQVFRRLPDIRIVPTSIVQAAPKGCSRKAQKLLNLSFYEEREPNQPRLFCNNPKQVKAAERQYRQSDLLPWHKPLEVYRLLYICRRSNIWATVPMGGLYCQ